jgi:CubicO group peptidase (beta-lactamase class C family)
MRAHLLPVAVLLSLLAVGRAEEKPAADDTGAKQWLAHGFTDRQRDGLRDVIRQGMARKFIPGGALLISHHGEVIFREAFGLADVAGNRPFTVDAPCRIASLTKFHTATLLAMLVEEGKLSWDDPVDKYLPSFAHLKVKGSAAAARPPKIRELLSHTAGFPGNDDLRRASDRNFNLDGTLAEAVEAVAKADLAAQPGTVYAYTGLGYLVAGRIAEIVSGQEFAALMTARLLKPVGATTATFYPGASEALKARMPTRYERKGDQLVIIPEGTGGSEAGAAFPSPGGGLISTLDDVARVLALHRDGGIAGGKRLISTATLKELYTAQPATGRTGYGFGFNIMRRGPDGTGDRIRHVGASGTLAMLDFKEDFTMVLLTQVPFKQTGPFTDRLVKEISAQFANR